MKAFRIILGIVIWAALTAGLWKCFDQNLVAGGGIRDRLAPDLWDHMTGEHRLVELKSEQAIDVRVGDPVFLVDGPNSVRQIGEIQTVYSPEDNSVTERARANRAGVMFYPSAASALDSGSLVYYSSDNSMSWVVQTMLPPEKRHEIALEIATAFQENHQEVIAALKPIVEDSLRESVEVVRSDLAAAIARHRPEIEKLGSRYQKQMVRQELVPLVQSQIWPIARRHAEPTANKIGQEIWKRVPVWRFTWKYIYDKSPLPEKNRFRKEWDRFVEKEIIPVFESHSGEIVDSVQHILIDTSKNKKVQAAVKKNMSRILEDEELRKVLMAIMREVFIDNPRLKQTFEKHWNSPRARQAFQLATDRLEPTVRRIGDQLFGSRATGISPEFARVLRNQILGKDKHWFVLEQSADGNRKHSSPEKLVLRVRVGHGTPINPFVHAENSNGNGRRL